MKRATTLFSIVLLLLSSGKILAQSYSDLPGMDQVTVIDSDKIIHAHILATTPDFVPASNRFYCWFKSGNIISTEGGFGGNLLDGLFTESYPNKNLCQQGIYQNGLKEGNWKNWNLDGTYANTFNFHNGLKSGIYWIFDSSGQLTEHGLYRKGKLNGRQVRFLPDGKTQVFRYRNGLLKSADKPGLLKKLSGHLYKLIGHSDSSK